MRTLYLSRTDLIERALEVCLRAITAVVEVGICQENHCDEYHMNTLTQMVDVYSQIALQCLNPTDQRTSPSQPQWIGGQFDVAFCWSWGGTSHVSHWWLADETHKELQRVCV